MEKSRAELENEIVGLKRDIERLYTLIGKAYDTIDYLNDKLDKKNEIIRAYWDVIDNYD